MNSGARIRLSVGLALPVRLATSAVLVIVAGIVSLIAAAGLGAGPFAGVFAPPQAPQLASGLPGGSLPPLDTPSAVGTDARIVGVIAAAMAVVVLYLLLYIWRSGVWLEGTVVTQRGVLLSRRADLARAVIRMGAKNYTSVTEDQVFRTYTTHRVPALVVSSPRGFGSVKVPLRGRGLDLLPESQLAALARAVGSNRGPQADRAQAIAALLRELSQDPLAF